MEAIWLLPAGLTIFMYGMAQMEGGIGHIGRARLKHWIVQGTDGRLRSIGLGVGVTALLQSSSLVSLLVLAFASAGAIPLFNAIGVILGANLGTTFTGWVVATIGFNLNLDSIAIPLLGLGCFLQIMFKAHTRWRASGTLLLGLGLLLFGLDLMKGAVEDLPGLLNIAELQGLPTWAYLLIGTAITAVLQSSSATMVIIMTALHSGVLGLPDAVAIAIGADLGTTSTTILGSVSGHSIKRQLALAHVVFNVTVDLGAFLFLLPVLPLILDAMHISNPLYGLVAFHSLFNFLGLLIFIPILKPYANWIGRRFQHARHRSALRDMPTDVPEAALTALNLALRSLLIDATALNLHNIRSSPEQLRMSGELTDQLTASYREAMTFEQRYEQIKQQENAITEFALSMQQHELDASQARALAYVLSASRLIVYACKGLKDSREHLATLRHDKSELGTRLSKEHCENQLQLYRSWLPLFFGEHESTYIDEQHTSLKQLNDEYQRRCEDEVYRAESLRESGDLDRSTLLNINREIHHAGENLLLALKQWNEFNQQPN
ncbi:MAG: phosphate:Na+ symporter [Gammaproteobacteria bacterium]